jgi:hypothetical protein
MRTGFTAVLRFRLLALTAFACHFLPAAKLVLAAPTLGHVRVVCCSIREALLWSGSGHHFMAHWHVDVSYINIAGTFYHLCSLLDGCSGYTVHWEIRNPSRPRKRARRFRVTSSSTSTDSGNSMAGVAQVHRWLSEYFTWAGLKKCGFDAQSGLHRIRPDEQHSPSVRGGPCTESGLCAQACWRSL